MEVKNMSGIGYKAKGALALALSMALFSTTLFADTRAYAAQAVSKAEENILPELTYCLCMCAHAHTFREL